MKKIKLNNWFLEDTLNAYFSLKEVQSRIINQVASKADRSNLIDIPFVNELDYIYKIGDYTKKIEYVPDPKTFDYYTHPELMQKGINDKFYKYSKDCDDFSSYAFAQLNKRIEAKYLTVASIIPNLIINPINIKWCHTIMLGLYNKGFYDSGHVWVYSIDTNGLNWYQLDLAYQDVGIDDILEFKTRDEKIVKNLVLERFSKIYNTKYELLVNHGYAFNV